MAVELRGDVELLRGGGTKEEGRGSEGENRRRGETKRGEEREEKKEIINEHRIEVKNTVDVDAILKKAINKGINQLDSPKQVH